MQRLRELKKNKNKTKFLSDINKIWPIASSAQIYAQKAHLKASFKK